MTRDERTEIRFAINAAKRAWLEREGGFRSVESDARAMDQRISGGGRHNRDRHQQARRLRDQGLSYVAIGRELAVHHSTVYTWLNSDRQTRLLAQQKNRRSHTRSQSTSDVG
jgi:DNA invertase Pin-like site-specific DNA recombinase